MRGRLCDLIRQRVEIQNLWVGINRRDAVLVCFRLHVGENVVALLHLHQRIANAWAVLPVAGKRVQHAPMIVHGFVARFAVHVAREAHVAAVGKQREQLVAQGFVFDPVKSPRTEPRAVKGDEVHQRVAGMDGGQPLLDTQP